MTTSLYFWLFRPEVWAIIGIVLIGLEFFTSAMIALPIGIAALITAGLVHGHNDLWFGDTVLFETWRGILVCFAVLTVLSVGVVRWIFQRRSTGSDGSDDINEY